jgi:hypothetical protein
VPTRTGSLVRQLLVALLLLAPAIASAQVRDTTRARPDTVRRDTTLIPVPTAADSARADSIARANRDTIKAPVAHAEIPVLADIGGEWRWDREQIMRSNASTLADLLDQVPGFTSYRASWIATPQAGAFAGAFDRVRLFLDGFELDALDPRMNGMNDLSLVQLWLLEEIVVERAPGELRVHLRSWREDRTDARTRVDVSTGDLETNTYRGYYGKRIRHGELLQVAAQQWSTVDRLGVDGDMATLFVRTGWAKGNWHGDLLFQRAARSATSQPRVEISRPPLSPQDLRQDLTYARLGWGDPDRGNWLQLLAAVMSANERSPRQTQDSAGIPVDTVDTNTVRRQLVLTGGVQRWGVRASGTLRMRRFEGANDFSPGFRLAYDRRWLSATAYAERSSLDSVLRVDGILRVSPTGWFSASVGASQRTPDGDGDIRPSSSMLRAEAGLRLNRVWVSGGAMRVDTLLTGAPTVFDTGFRSFISGARTGIFTGIRGKFWRDVGVDVMAIKWDSELDAYLPEYQVLSRLFLDTYWEGRFPRRNLRILAQLQHEYRTEAGFPLTAPGAAPLLSTQFRTLSALLEIRLYDAAVFWQFRNAQNAEFVTVPGFQMPRAMNLYGVRWAFLN